MEKSNTVKGYLDLSVQNCETPAGDTGTVDNNAGGIPHQKIPKTRDVSEEMEQESREFAYLKPICALVLQNPSTKNLTGFKDALKTVGKVPPHMSDFVVFPFAIHLKVIKKYNEKQRTEIFQTLAKLLENAELRSSYDMFVNIFQKLHVALSAGNDLTAVNKHMSEEEMEAIVEAIRNLTITSLSFHMDTICLPDKIQVFGHSIYILLQLTGLDFPKFVRLNSLEIILHVVELCDGKEERSKVLYKFLPGIISSLRKISLPSAGQSVKSIVQKSLNVMGRTITICTTFESAENVDNADGMLCKILELLSKEFLLQDDVNYRRSFFEFCRQIALRSEKLPKCSKTITSILLRMKGDTDFSISSECTEVLQSLGVIHEIKFEDLANLLQSAIDHLKSGNDDTCVLDLREVSSLLAARKLSFVEFQCFVPVVFQLVNELVWKFRNSISVNSIDVQDPVFSASAKVCGNLTIAVDIDELVYEFSSILTDMQYNPTSVANPTGVIVTFNRVLSTVVHEKMNINEYEAATIAQTYLSLLDMQSTEVVLNAVATDIPGVQSAADIRKAYLLEGLGILGSVYRNNVIPIVLYSLIEHAGSQHSDILNATATSALIRISSPDTLDKFFRENLEFILSEVSVRLLNLGLYPNCPNALVFLADYFNFGNGTFSGFIDQVFDRCSDMFGGGNVQHIYVKVFYALMKSISKHWEGNATPDNTTSVQFEKKSLAQRMLEYQKSVGVVHPSLEKVFEKVDSENTGSEHENNECTMDDTAEQQDNGVEEIEEALHPTLHLALRICQRALNFLPNIERSVRLTAMDCLILGIPLLKQHENSLLPLCHTVWQNLVPRLQEKDYVIVRKSFELLLALCSSSGTFLKKRTIEEAFPRLSTLLFTLALESEQVKNKNRQYYTFTQAYKLQLSVLQGMGTLLEAIEISEFDLDKVVGGCLIYLKPDQHKNLQDAARKLLEKISNGRHARTVWMKLVKSGLKLAPDKPPHPLFIPIPGQYSN